MRIENSWIRFEENGERITGKKGKIKKNRNDKLYFEIHEVNGEKVVRINVNDYIAQRINEIDTDYVTLRCKDASRNFVEVKPAEHPAWDVHDDAPSVAFDEVSAQLEKRELILALARVIDFYDNVEYVDDTVETLVSQLQGHLEEKLGVS